MGKPFTPRGIAESLNTGQSFLNVIIPYSEKIAGVSFLYSGVGYAYYYVL